MESEIVITKRICKTTWDEYQFLTSGYPNRNDKERIFESSDGMWRKDFLPELKADEYDKEYNGEPCPRQGIEVDMHISREKKKGYRKMWCFGFVGRSRCITQYKPQKVRRGEDCTSATIKHGSVYVDLWCEYDRFPEIQEGKVFPVYVMITRKTKQ